MPRVCTICSHYDIDKIDKQILEGISLRNIAERYSLSATSVHRHKKHLKVNLLKANEVKEMARADTLLEQVKDLQSRALSVLYKAEESQDWRAANGAIREARACIELLGKLAGELQEGTKVNIIVSAQWLELRTTIIKALESYPEAKLAITRALEDEIRA